eukprot:4923822-Lingulodinium_polyedra.AAC.1
MPRQSYAPSVRIWDLNECKKARRRRWKGTFMEIDGDWHDEDTDVLRGPHPFDDRFWYTR